MAASERNAAWYPAYSTIKPAKSMLNDAPTPAAVAIAP
jgi:hypothetical protein